MWLRGPRNLSSDTARVSKAYRTLNPVNSGVFYIGLLRVDNGKSVSLRGVKRRRNLIFRLPRSARNDIER